MIPWNRRDLLFLIPNAQRMGRGVAGGRQSWLHIKAKCERDKNGLGDVKVVVDSEDQT